MAIKETLCPECGGKMISRLNRAKNQRFWGCAKYHECKGTRNTDGEAPRRWDENARPEPDGSSLPSDRQRDNDKRRW